jgi:hypothetical protein
MLLGKPLSGHAAVGNAHGTALSDHRYGPGHYVLGLTMDGTSHRQLSKQGANATEAKPTDE